MFREVAVIFLSTFLLFFIEIMCTTSKRDVGLARSLKYLSLKGYKILMEVWCWWRRVFLFVFFLFLKEHIQPQKPYVSMQLEYSCSSILLNFLSLQSWIGFQLELAFNLNWLCRKAKGSLRVLIPACSQVISSFCSCIFVFLVLICFICPCTRILMDFTFAVVF